MPELSFDHPFGRFSTPGIKFGLPGGVGVSPSEGVPKPADSSTDSSTPLIREVEGITGISDREGVPKPAGSSTPLISEVKGITGISDREGFRSNNKPQGQAESTTPISAPKTTK